ncbi:MAG: C40 family peptidase [Sphingobacterium composti]
MMRQLQFFIVPICFLFILGSCGAKRKSSVTGPSKTTVERPSSGKRADVKQYYADLLGTNPKELNVLLYEFVDEWMGSPHRMGGQTKSGIDCSGFVGVIYQQVYGKNLPRSSRDMSDVIKRKYDNQLKEGDLVFFSFGGKVIDHVGIYLHNDKFVHVSTKQGVVISNLKDPWYYKYFTRCGTPQL